MDDARTRRLAERIAKIVAELLERRIKDPRLGFVTVTEARLTNDLREAKVFYTVFGTPEERADTAVALRDRRHPFRGGPPDRPAVHPVS
jgi:ribosome-binding factor A